MKRYTGSIQCEFCPATIRGGSKSLLFSNYTAHVESKHPTYRPVAGYRSSVFGAKADGELRA